MMLPPSFLHAPIAHRALHDRAQGRIENALSAIQAAVQAGYGIEIDLQLSADGQPMVFHDYMLDRLTGETGMINQRRAAEMQTIALTDGRGDCIPTFAQVLATVAGKVPLLVELKDQDGNLGSAVGRLEQAAADALKGYRGDVAVMSFNPNSVRVFGGMAPHIPRGLTTCAFDPAEWAPVSKQRLKRLADIPDYQACGASFISHQAADLASPRVAQLRAQGAAILCWTIRSPQAEAEARKIAQNITFEGYHAAIPV